MLKSGSGNLKMIDVCFSIPLLVSLAAALIQPNVAIAGDFSKTCRDMRTESDGSGRIVLVAKCHDRDGFTLWSQNGRPVTERRLVISDYVANYDGNLAWAHNGNFQASCSEIRIYEGGQMAIPQSPYPVPVDGPVMLQARCGDGKGGYKVSTLDLNQKISNQNGVPAVDHF